MEDIQLSTFRELVKAFRTQRKMTQQELAKRIGAHRNTVGSWERGDVLPESKTIVLEVAHQLRLDSQETRRLLEASLTALSAYWLMPSPRNSFFTGREDVLQQLHDVLAQEYTAVLSQSYALSGLGGIGKTQTAIEYAYRHANDYAAVFWISAETTETIITSMVAIATLLNLPETQEHDQEKVALAVTRWLSNHRDWLLILDNIEDPALVKRFLPPARCGSLLFTSRRQVLGLAGKTLDLEQMTPQEGLRFLLHRSRRLDPTLSLADFPSMEKAFAQEIVAAMDGLPLALEQAGAYIEETGCSFGHYLQLYQNHRSALLARRGMQTTNYPDSVATTWSLSFQQVEQANPAAAELLRLCAFLAPDHIPEELFTDASEHWPPVLQQATANPIAFDQLLAVLLSFSLIKRLTENHLLNIHRLVQVVQLDMMSPGEQHEWAERIVHAVNTVFPRDPKEDVASWPQCLRYLEQAQACNTLIQQWHLTLPEGADLLDRTGCYLFEHASYTLAEPLYQRALHIWEQSLGSEHPQVAYPLHGLGILYWEQGKFAEAEPLYQRALHIWEQSLGPEHPQVAYPLNGLANLHLKQGKFAEAELLFQRALHIWEQSLGSEHPQVAYPLHGLGILHREQGKFAEAEPLYQRALHIREQSLGSEHPLVAAPLNGLAELYREQGKNARAEPLYQRALHIREQSLGPEHPQVAHPLNNLAELYLEQGKDARAELLFQRALHIWEQSLGPEHPLMAHPLIGLADLCCKQGKDTEAELLYQRALHIREQSLGPEHPLVAYPLTGLANLYLKQGKDARAESLFQRALHIWEQSLGPDHPLVAYPLTDLAELYRDQGKFVEAEPLFQRAICIFEESLGPEHPNMAHMLTGLADLYRKQGKYMEAGPLFQRALRIREHAIEPDHPDIADTLHSFAALREAQDKSEEAVSLYRRALTIREQVYGPHHPKTIETRESLHTVLHLMSKDEREAQRDAEHLEQEGMKDTPDEGENVVTEPESTKWT